MICAFPSRCRQVIPADPVREGGGGAARHAHGGGDGRVAVYDTAGVGGGLRGVPAQAPGCPRAHHALRAHGHQLQAGVHGLSGVFIPVGADGALHERLQHAPGRGVNT